MQRNTESENEALETSLEQDDLESTLSQIEKLHPSDLAAHLEHLSPERIADIIRRLRFPGGIRVFEQLDIQTQSSVLDHLGRREIIQLLEDLSPDDRVDLLNALPSETVESLLPLMAQAEREEVRNLLQYGEHTAGALMTTEYALLDASWTVQEALVELHKIAPDSETLVYLYVVSKARKLLGTLSLKELVLARPYQKVQDLMRKDPIVLGVDWDQERVVRAFAKYDLFALPVLDADDRLVGLVTHDDAFDAIVEEQTEDVHRLGALEPMETPYLRTSILEMSRKRAFWLLFLLIGEFFTASALKHYEQTFQNALALIFFLPLIVASGGNSGSQSVTLITRALAIGDVRMRDFFKVFLRESTVGVAMGILLGLVGVAMTTFLDTPPRIAWTVGIALLGVVTIGSLIGSILPMLIKRLGMDPAIMSSPLVASIVDVIGVVIYFGLAGWLLN